MIKVRRRGVSGGELVLAMAESQLVGGECLDDIEELRADQAGAGLRTAWRVPENAAGVLPSELDGLDYALAVSGDDALNAMAASDLTEYFAADHVFQLPVGSERDTAFQMRARQLFQADATHVFVKGTSTGKGPATNADCQKIAADLDTAYVALEDYLIEGDEDRSQGMSDAIGALEANGIKRGCSFAKTHPPA